LFSFGGDAEVVGSKMALRGFFRAEVVGRGKKPERFLSAQADPSQELKGEEKVGLLRSE